MSPMPRKNPNKTEMFRDLPSVDELLRSDIGRDTAAQAGREHATRLARRAVADVRASLADTATKAELMQRTADALASLWRGERLLRIRRVINATGVIIHTNLGRAPLSKAAREAIVSAALSANVEYYLASGKRGRRGAFAEQLIVELTGAEDALVVNNCAAAAFFVLKAFAYGGEVVISRGEMVEIGGDFRVPDVLERSDATLREVGTTNRTKLADYQNAIGKNTRMLLRVHPSNYRIVGFTATPSTAELAKLAKSKRIVYYEDLGSGALVDLSQYGLADEPVVPRAIKDGAEIVSFSGDKLLGGPQCGIIAGKRKLIEQLRKHPLQRALRVDKTAFAALEATLLSYRQGSHMTDIPVLSQLSARPGSIERRASRLVKAVGKTPLTLKVVEGRSVVGGGAAPDVHPPTFLISVTSKKLSARAIEEKLRANVPPVISRVDGGRVILDLRTVAKSDEAAIVDALRYLG